MFDIGFLEILIIIVIAVLALGPDKLPAFTMDAIKMFKAIKKTITNAKDSIETEINIEDMKASMQTYQDSIDFTKNEIKSNNPKEKAKKEIDKINKMISPDTKTKEQETPKRDNKKAKDV